MLSSSTGNVDNKGRSNIVVDCRIRVVLRCVFFVYVLCWHLAKLLTTACLLLCGESRAAPSWLALFTFNTPVCLWDEVLLVITDMSKQLGVCERKVCRSVT